MLSIITRAQILGWRVKDRLRGEAGQTSSEYLVIGGIIVALIVGILSAFSTSVRNSFTQFTQRVTQAIFQ
jgi:Flp pilus assembly pilin Flp